jgi:hypothetical protein
MLQNLPVGCNDENVSLKRAKGVQHFRTIDSLRLKDGNIAGNRHFLHGIDVLMVTAPRPIRLRQNSYHRMFRIEQSAKRRHCEFASTHKNKSKSHENNLKRLATASHEIETGHEAN